MFKAIGLILLIVAVRLMMPDVFHGLEATLVQFFGLLQGAMAKSQTVLQASPTLGW